MMLLLYVTVVLTYCIPTKVFHKTINNIGLSEIFAHEQHEHAANNPLQTDKSGT